MFNECCRIQDTTYSVAYKIQSLLRNKNIFLFCRYENTSQKLLKISTKISLIIYEARIITRTEAARLRQRDKVL